MRFEMVLGVDNRLILLVKILSEFFNSKRACIVDEIINEKNNRLSFR